MGSEYFQGLKAACFVAIIREPDWTFEYEPTSQRKREVSGSALAMSNADANKP
jgi:hypothetical protein